MPQSDEIRQRLDARRQEILGRMAVSDRVVDHDRKARLRASVLDMPTGWQPIMMRFLDELEADFPDVNIIGLVRRADGTLYVPFKLHAAGWTLERHREVDQWIEVMKAECWHTCERCGRPSTHILRVGMEVQFEYPNAEVGEFLLCDECSTAMREKGFRHDD